MASRAATEHQPEVPFLSGWNFAAGMIPNDDAATTSATPRSVALAGASTQRVVDLSLAAPGRPRLGTVRGGLRVPAPEAAVGRSSAPRTISLTGACDSGKSTLLSVGQRVMAEHFGRTATIDADVLQMMVGPGWELPEDECDLELSEWQCWLLARSFLTHGFDTVIIGSNGFHTRAEGLNDMIGFLLSVGDVHYVTLDASIEEIQRRVVDRGSD